MVGVLGCQRFYLIASATSVTTGWIGSSLGADSNWLSKAVADPCKTHRRNNIGGKVRPMKPNRAQSCAYFIRFSLEGRNRFT